jgi:hypothetical protein
MGSVEGSEDEKLTQAVLDSTYLVQEYIDGGTLRDQVLKQARVLSCRPKRLLSSMLEAACSRSL